MADLLSTFNYLVPASGGTHAYPVSGVFSAAPLEIDFRFIELDGETFTPSGVFIDNSAGIGDLVITILGANFSVVCPAGGRLATQYPAPLNQQARIVGNGQASVMFVDFPVIPFFQAGAASLGAVTIADGADVALGDTGDAAATAPYATATVVALLKALNVSTDLQVPDIDAIRVAITALALEMASPANAARTDVADSAASQVILAANAARKGCVIWNDSTSILYLLLDNAAATTTNFTYVLQPQGSVTIQKGEYTGEIRGIWSADAAGSARITEFT